MHPAFYIGVAGVTLGVSLFALTHGGRMIVRDVCWVVIGLSLAAAAYGAVAGMKGALTGSEWEEGEG